MTGFSYQTDVGGLPRPQRANGRWWCPACSLLVEAEKNPVLCDECDGDMTIAPDRVVDGREKS